MICISGGEEITNVDSKGTYEPKYSHSLSIKLDKKTNHATLTIDNNVVYDFVARRNQDKIDICLRSPQILPVWFNAWRYEREEQFALIALMKTLAYAMGGLPTYREVKKVLIRGLGIIGKDVLRNFALKYLMTDQGVKEFEKTLLPKMDLLSKVDKDTIYFEGMKTIEDEMKKISPPNSIVVFIDDLDRCSPKKALEVFESTKVFLDIPGFIYVIGLSHVTVSKLITAEYEKSNIKGEHYIKKIIQIPLILPGWTTGNLEEYIEKVLSKKLDAVYSTIVKENKSCAV